MTEPALEQPSQLPTTAVNDPTFNTADRRFARRYVVMGYLVTALFFGSIAAWATLVPISSAAIAPGVVGKDGYRKTVQHLEGGIIHRIAVADGDTVSANQVLIELADLRSRSDYQLLEKQKAIIAAKEAVLLAEQKNEDDYPLPEWIDLDALEPAVRDSIEGQMDATRAARALHEEKRAILNRQIERGMNKLRALRQENSSLLRSGRLVQEELREYEQLQREGLVTRRVIFDLRRQIVDNETELSSNGVALQTTAQELNDLDLERANEVGLYQRQIREDLDAVREQRVQLDEKLSKTGDTLERTVIRAPTGGVVVNLQVNTVGGVVAPGQPLLEIVPSSGKLIIDAKVDPMDRDTVRVGQRAEVRFTAFNRRMSGPVAGRVTMISADRLLAPVTNEPFYQAKIELLEDPSKLTNGGEIYPGMQADVLIVTGSRTALSYLTSPIIKSFDRAFRED